MVKFEQFQPTFLDKNIESQRLKLVVSKPRGAISANVHSIIQITSVKPTCYRVIPDGTQMVFISKSTLAIAGIQTRMRELVLPKAGDYLGVRFFPGGMGSFTRNALAEIKNEFVDSQFLNLRNKFNLIDRLYSTKAVNERFKIIESWLESAFNFQNETRLARPLDAIRNSSGLMQVKDLAMQIQIGERQLNRLFNENIGISVKGFCQIARLQAACYRLFHSRKPLVDTAIESGYSDQSHMNHVMKKTLGLSPRQLTTVFMSDLYNTR